MLTDEKRKEAVNLIDSALTSIETDTSIKYLLIEELQQALLILDLEKDVIAG